MRKRGMPSPDSADAMALTFSEPDGSPIPAHCDKFQSRDRISGPRIRLRFIRLSATGRRDDGDAGACAVGGYYVADGVVVMCNEIGKPTGKTYRLGPGDNERQIASRLTLQAWRSRTPDFNRPLNYQPLGVA